MNLREKKKSESYSKNNENVWESEQTVLYKFIEREQHF